MGAKLSEDEVQRALDFCVNLFSPTTPEQHAAVRDKLRSLQSSPLILTPPDGTGTGTQTPSTPPKRPAPPQRANTGPDSRGQSMKIVTTMAGLGFGQDEDTVQDEETVKDEDAERRFMDVHAPIVSPRTLTQFLKTRFTRNRSNTMPAPRVTSLASPPTSPTSSTFGPKADGDPTGRKRRYRSGTVSTAASRSRTGPSLVTTPALSMSSSLSGTGMSTPRSTLSSVPSDDEGDEHDEFHDASDYLPSIFSSEYEKGNGVGAFDLEEKHVNEEVDDEIDGEKGEKEEDEEEEVSEMKMVLDKVNARRVIHAEHGGLNGLESEAVAGFVVRLVRGDLGLSRAAASVQEE